MHIAVQHAAEQVVAQIVMLFAHHPGAFGVLKIENPCAKHPQRIFKMGRKLIFQTGFKHIGEKQIQPFALPPAIHITFTQAQRALLQDAFIKIGVFDLRIGGGRAIYRDSRFAEQVVNDTEPLIVP